MDMEDSPLSEIEALVDKLESENEVGTSNDDTFAQAMDFLNQPPEVTKKPSEREGDLIPGLISGAHQTVNLINNAGNSALYHLLFKATGDEKYRLASESYYNDYQNVGKAIAEKYPRNVDSLKDAKNSGDVVDWMQRMFGEGVTSWIPGLAAGTAAAGLGAGPAAITAAVTGTNFLTQMLPETHVNFKAAGVDDAGMMLLAASAKTGLESFMPIQMIKKAFGGKMGDAVVDKVTGLALGKLLGKEVAVGAATEGITEAGQQLVDQAAVSFLDENQELFSEENLWQVMEAGLAGAIVGGPVAGAAGTIANREAVISEAQKLTNVITAPIQDKIRKKAEAEIDADTQAASNGFADVGSAIDFLANAGVDPTIFSSAESTIKAANRLKAKKVREDSMSPATSKAVSLPEQKKLPAPSKPITPDAMTEYYKERAMEIMRAEILKTPDAQALVAHGINPSDVVGMDFDTMNKHAEAVRKSKDANSSKELGTPYVGTDPQQQAMTKKQLLQKKDRLGQITRDMLSKDIAKMDEDWLNENKVNFDVGDGVIINMEPQRFWDEMSVVEAQRNARNDEMQTNATKTQSAAPLQSSEILYGKGKNQTQAPTGGLGQTQPTSQQTLSLPTSPKIEKPIEIQQQLQTQKIDGLSFKEKKEPKLNKPLSQAKLGKNETQTKLTEYNAPLIPASKNLPWNDARTKKAKAKAPKKARPQAFLPTAAERKLHQRTIVPQIVFNNLRATPVHLSVQPQLAEISKNIHRIVREMAGKNVEVKFVGTLEALDPLTHEPVATLRGAQERNILYIALNNNPNAIETAYHEAWHYIRDELGLLTDADKKLLDIELPRMKAWLQKEYDIADSDMEWLGDSREEVEATAFGKLATDPQAVMNSPAARVFKKVLNFFNRLQNYLRGAGFRTFEDLFGTVANGKYSKAADYHDNNLNEMSQARFQTLSKNVANKVWKQSQEKQDQFKNGLAQAIAKEGDRGLADKAQYFRNRWLNSIAGARHNDPLIAAAFQLQQDKTNITHEYLTRYQNMMRPFFANFSVKDRHKILYLTNKVRLAKAKAEYITDASTGQTIGMRFKDADGVMKTINNAKVAKGYKQVQEGFNQALNDIENAYRNTLTHHGLARDMKLEQLGREIEGLNQDLTDIDANLDNINEALKRDKDNVVLNAQKDALKADKLYTKEVKDDVQSIYDNLEGMEQLRKSDYIPHSRFGRLGLSVWHKADLSPNKAGKMVPIEGRKPAYFATFEDGFHKGADKFQWNLTQKELKRRGLLDSPDYVIYGKDKPFYLTKGLMENYITSSMITYEMLAGLLGDSDPKTYEAVRTKMEQQLQHKNFAKILSHNHNVPGYSQDWNRVVPYYFAGMAHMLGKNAVAPRMATMNAMIRGGGLSSGDDDTLGMTKGMNETRRKTVEEYLDYMQSPMEDYLGMRQMNFLWTMGMNVSSAALQIFTLPTSTLSSMTQYNSNPYQNAKFISKWFKNGIKWSGNKDVTERLLSEGQLDLGWTQPAKIAELSGKGEFVKKTPNMTTEQWKKLNSQYADGISQMIKIGALRGFLAEDYAGRGSQDIRTTKGRISEKTSMFTSLLGVPISAAESLTRFATFMAHFDMFMQDPAAVARAERLLKDDYAWQAMRQDSPNSVQLDLARFGTDEAHAVFGKGGRHKLQRGLGGALFIPFMTYPHQQLEFMSRMYGRGKEGKMALAVNLAVLMAFSGLMGLPGAELLKEMYEGIHKQISGHEIDLDKIIRSRISDMTDSPAFAVFMTQGIGRPVMGMDIGKRLGMGLAYPGSAQLAGLFSGKDLGIESLGVQGSMINNAMRGWETYSSGGSAPAVLENISPNFLANLIKGYRYGHEGVMSAKGNMLIPPEDVDFGIRFKRVLGITPGEVANARERAYWSDMTGREYDSFLRRQRQQMANLRVSKLRAQRAGDYTKANKFYQKERFLIESLKQWKKETGYPLNFSSFGNSVKKMVKNRMTGDQDKKRVRKNTRRQLKKIEEITNL